MYAICTWKKLCMKSSVYFLRPAFTPLLGRKLAKRTESAGGVGSPGVWKAEPGESGWPVTPQTEERGISKTANLASTWNEFHSRYTTFLSNTFNYSTDLHFPFLPWIKTYKNWMQVLVGFFGFFFFFFFSDRRWCLALAGWAGWHFKECQFLSTFCCKAEIHLVLKAT